MGKKKRRYSLILQVSVLFILSILVTGQLAYFSQRLVADTSVTRQTESRAGEIADEVKAAIREYPTCEWLIRYWYEHADEMDIEYDAEYREGTRTEEKCRLLEERYPEQQLRYVYLPDIQRMTEEDQKLYAEICYSWMITRVNQIKRVNGVDFLFCVLTDDDCKEQFFLFSGADPGARRGTNYEEVYTLGVTATVAESQQLAMQNARLNSQHLADAGDYVDYYSYFGKVADHDILIGMTYNLSGLKSDVNSQTSKSTIYAVAYQVLLSLLSLILIYFFVLRPLKKVQKNIRLYKNTKDSEIVTKDLSQVRLHNEIGELSEDVSALATELDDYMDQIETITAEKERVSTELEMATQIQAGMLPSIFPPFPERCEFDIYASMDPAREVGGDFYDFFLIDDDHVCLVMADVSGKGVPAALFMMASKIILANNAMQGKSPAEVLTATNEMICENNREEMFVTVWLGILEISTGRLTASNAGHEYPVIRHASGQFELFKDKHGFVIGGMSGARYKDYEIVLDPGARLFLYTDGVPEATDAEAQMFGTDRMLAALNEAPGAAPKQILKNVRRAVDAFVKDAEQFDDLTMLCLEYNGKDGAAGRTENER